MKIVFSCAASDDYVEKYKSCIQSQKDYCSRNDYEYHLESKDDNIQDWREWYWKKIYTLKNFYNSSDIIVLIDADCEIKTDAPAIESVIDESFVYYVLGISKRPNSGFLIFKNILESHTLIDSILKKRNLECPDEFKSKGENGAVIWALSEIKSGKKELDIRWNCSLPEHAKEAYIIHYTNKMRSFFQEEV
jgi:hypothetical protein